MSLTVSLTPIAGTFRQRPLSGKHRNAIIGKERQVIKKRQFVDRLMAGLTLTVVLMMSAMQPAKAQTCGALATPTPAASPALSLYVATTGKNTNSGTAASPFATIQYALTKAISNTTVNIMAGSYQGPVNLPAVNNLSLIANGRVVLTGSHGIMSQTAATNGLTLSGLTFQNNQDVYLGGSAVSLEEGGTGLTVNSCSFSSNGWAGLIIGFWNGVAISNFAGSDNGENALEAYRVQNLTENGVTLTNNNTVGYANGYTGSDADGEKLLRIHTAALNNITITGNYTGGLWFDTDNENITVCNLVSEHNLTNGFNCEATQGPLTISQSTIAYNGGNGLATGNCNGLTITNSVIYGNVKAQIQAASDGPVTFTDFITGAPVSVVNANWTIKQNDIVSNAGYPQGYLWGNAMDDGDWPAFLNSFSSNSNDWYSINAYPFAVPEDSENLAQWRSYTGQDAASYAAAIQAP